jgi:hypothetical protein
MTRPSAVERPATCRGRWGTSSCAVQYGDRYIPGAIRSYGLRFSFAAESRIPATEGPRARYDSSCRELAALNEQDSTPYVPKTDEERNEAFGLLDELLKELGREEALRRELARSLLKLPLEELEPVMTIVGGKIVFETGYLEGILVRAGGRGHDDGE